MTIKLSNVQEKLKKILRKLGESPDNIRAMNRALKAFLISVQHSIDTEEYSEDTELTEEASVKFDNMLEKVSFFKENPSEKDRETQAITAIKQFMGIPIQNLLNISPEEVEAPLTVDLSPKKSTKSIPKTDLPPTDQEKLEQVRAYLKRWAAAEEHAKPSQRIGYAEHLKWLEANEKLAKGPPPDKKAQLIVNAYTSVPGFGAKRDKHEFINLHMDIELLDLEIEGLKKQSPKPKELQEKQEEARKLRKNLETVLKEENKKLYERFNESVRKNPELRPYLEPIVQRYSAWLLKINKRGAMPPFTILDGPPGTGKTYIGQEIADVLGIDFQKVVMSSEGDTTIVPGRNKGWEDPKPGKGAEFQMASESQLFLWFSDELEKAEKPVINTHVDLFESGQSCYKDKFFNDLNIPKLFTVFSATTNDYDILPGHIKNRALKVIVKGKKPEEKLDIIKKMLKKGIEDSSMLKEKEITFDPDEDTVILWFLKTYSSQPGFREDTQHVNEILSKLTVYFSENPGEIGIKITQDFIRKALPPPSIHHKRKVELWELISKVGTELQKYNEALSKACNPDGQVKEGEQLTADKALAGQIANKVLMRSYIQDLIAILKEELLQSTDNRALIEPEIKDLSADLEQFKRFTALQIKFISNNLDKIEEYGLTIESLTKLIGEQLEKLKISIEEQRREKLRLEHSDKPGELENVNAKLAQYREEENVLESLRRKLHSKETLEQQKDKPKSNEEQKREKDIAPNNQDQDEASSAKKKPLQKPASSETEEQSLPSVLTFSGTHKLSHSPAKRASTESEKPKSTPDTSTPSSSGRPTIRTPGGSLFWQSRVSEEIAKHPTLKIESSQTITPELFGKIIQELDSQIKERQARAEREPEKHPEDVRSFKNLSVSSNSNSAQVLRGSEEILNIQHKGKAVEIVASQDKPEDDELYSMVLAAKIAAEKCGRPLFIIEHCEDNAATAFKLYLIGKSMGLLPSFKDAPGQSGETLRNMLEGDYGKKTLWFADGEKTIAQIYKEVQEGKISDPKTLNQYIALLMEDDTPSSKLSPGR